MAGDKHGWVSSKNDVNFDGGVFRCGDDEVEDWVEGHPGHRASVA